MANERSARAGSRTSHESRKTATTSSVDRTSRDNADEKRVDDGFEVSASDREAMLRNDVMQNLLPPPPKVKGVHWFYASMNHPQGISWYKRLGYRAVRVDDPTLKGWVEEAMKTGTGEYSGCVTINEMLLMKASDADYQRYMKIIHHEKPLEEQGAVRNQIDSAKETIDRESAGQTEVREVGSGLRQMDRKVKTPSKFEG